MIAPVAFWGSAAAVAYAYAGFPLVVLARAAVRPRPHRRADAAPSVSVVISAYNEVASIGAKLDNLLALDYPADRLEVVVASDGSTDGTNEVIARYVDRGVRLLALGRVGKASALNAAVAAASGDVLVFSDANSMFAPDALRMLVRNFADPEVGGVAGDQRYVKGATLAGTAAGEESYWSFDRALKEAESRAGSTISATGAIYAIRRELFTPVVDGVTDDFYTSTGVIAAGRRLVFDRDAIAYEPVAASTGVEFGRKVRVMTRGLRAVQARRALLDPRRHGFYALQLVSHKVLRRLVVVPLLVIAASTPFLLRRGLVYRLAAVGQLGVYGAGAVGIALRDSPLGRKKPLTIPAFFCLVNAASLQALWNLLRGNRIDRWEPQRTSGVAVLPGPPSVDLEARGA